MASLTPLSKGLIGLTIVAAVASAVWNLGLKERFGGTPAAVPSATVPAPTPAPAPAVAEPRGLNPTPVAATTPPAPTAPTQTAPVAAPPPVAATPDPAPTPTQSAAASSEAGRKLVQSGNFAQARIHLEQAVQAGDGAAACLLGDMTLKGQGGIAANPEQAAALFRLAQSRNMICFVAGN